MSSTLIRMATYKARPALALYVLESDYAPRLTHRKSALIAFKNVGFKITPFQTRASATSSHHKERGGLQRLQTSRYMLLRSIRIAMPTPAVSATTVRSICTPGIAWPVLPRGKGRRLASPFPIKDEERSSRRSFAAHA